MKLALALLLIGTTLGTGPAAFAVGQGLPASAHAVLHPAAEPGATLTLIDSDDDDKAGWLWPKSHDDDEDDDDCDENGDEDDNCKEGAANIAKPGTVAPPKNGLFTDGTAPMVKSN